MLVFSHPVTSGVSRNVSITMGTSTRRASVTSASAIVALPSVPTSTRKSNVGRMSSTKSGERGSLPMGNSRSVGRPSLPIAKCSDGVIDTPAGAITSASTRRSSDVVTTTRGAASGIAMSATLVSAMPTVHVADIVTGPRSRLVTSMPSPMEPLRPRITATGDNAGLNDSLPLGATVKAGCAMIAFTAVSVSNAFAALNRSRIHRVGVRRTTSRPATVSTRSTFAAVRRRVTSETSAGSDCSIARINASTSVGSRRCTAAVPSAAASKPAKGSS